MTVTEKIYALRYQTFGEDAILIEWPACIDPLILADILKFKAGIKEAYKHATNNSVHCVHAYHSLTIIFSQAFSYSDELGRLKHLYLSLASHQHEISPISPNQLTIPVCYHSDYAMDLSSYCAQAELSIAELVQLHTQPDYLVYFMGFLPGFVYLGGLDERLYLPRKDTPSPRIESGSIAIGGQQTGIYPQASPGGWHVIGRTPITLFNIDAKNMSPVQAGDHIRFSSIDAADFHALESELALGASVNDLGLLKVSHSHD